jgi:YfiH family protein
MNLVWLKAPGWERRDGLLHGFLGRRGGKSVGPYASLNVSFRVGDDPQAVKDNICDLKREVGAHDLTIVTMRQVHGDRIVDVKDNRLKEAGEADGMVIEERGLFPAVLTADCVPVLFTVRGRKLVAVAHAGWRGTLAGLAAKMVRHLKENYGVDAGSIEAALGPAIGPCCYEIGVDVSKPLTDRWGSLAERCLRPNGEKRFLDLRALNRLILEDAGVSPAQIFEVGPCTSCAVEDFFSYRHEKKETGRQISFIGWVG